MKLCKQNEKAIAWLALGTLEAEQSSALRAHLEACPGCRQRWEELSSLCRAHAAAGQALRRLPASDRFHQRLVRRLERSADQAAGRSLGWVPGGSLLRAWSIRWRRAAAPAALVLLAVALLSWPHGRPGGPRPPADGNLAMALPSGASDLEPTLANYQAALETSLDAFEDLLARQAMNGTATPDGASHSVLSELELVN